MSRAVPPAGRTVCTSPFVLSHVPQLSTSSLWSRKPGSGVTADTTVSSERNDSSIGHLRFAVRPGCARCWARVSRPRHRTEHPRLQVLEFGHWEAGFQDAADFPGV